MLVNGRAADADAAMSKAFGLGTRARDLLHQSLAIRGALDPLAASKAQASLATLP